MGLWGVAIGGRGPLGRGGRGRGAGPGARFGPAQWEEENSGVEAGRGGEGRGGAALRFPIAHNEQALSAPEVGLEAKPGAGPAGTGSDREGERPSW